MPTTLNLSRIGTAKGKCAHNIFNTANKRHEADVDM